MHGAAAALVLAEDDIFASIVNEHTAHVPQVTPYQPGASALREPPNLTVLAGTASVRLLVLHGYVHLDPHDRAGLGTQAHDSLDDARKIHGGGGSELTAG